VKEKCRLASATRVKRTTPTYSISTAAQRITPYALEIAHGQCKWLEKQYHIIRPCASSYVMIRKKYVPTTSIVSRFCIPREVKVHPTGHLTCSCLFWERHGIPCRHMYEILRKVSITDFDIRWWVAYATMYGSKEHHSFSECVDNIRARSSKGPQAPTDLPGGTFSDKYKCISLQNGMSHVPLRQSLVELRMLKRETTRR
jgi:hypothetical protein